MALYILYLQPFQLSLRAYYIELDLVMNPYLYISQYF